MSIQVGQAQATQSYVSQARGTARNGSAADNPGPINGKTIQSDSGASSAPNHTALKSPPTQQFAPDTVKVQLDNRDDRYPVVVYRFINNKSGDLVVQIPSQQDIDQTRAIAADFRTAAKTAAATRSTSKGNETI